MPFHRCRVTDAGPNANDGKVYIGLTYLAEGGFEGRWFYAAESQEREMLATALAAITSGLAVRADLEDGAPQYSRIEKLYISTRVAVD